MFASNTTPAWRKRSPDDIHASEALKASKDDNYWLEKMQEIFAEHATVAMVGVGVQLRHNNLIVIKAALSHTTPLAIDSPQARNSEHGAIYYTDSNKPIFCQFDYTVLEKEHYQHLHYVDQDCSIMEFGIYGLNANSESALDDLLEQAFSSIKVKVGQIFEYGIRPVDRRCSWLKDFGRTPAATQNALLFVMQRGLIAPTIIETDYFITPKKPTTHTQTELMDNLGMRSSTTRELREEAQQSSTEANDTPSALTA